MESKSRQAKAKEVLDSGFKAFYVFFKDNYYCQNILIFFYVTTVKNTKLYNF